MAKSPASPHPSGVIDLNQLRQAVALIRALNHSLRRQILELLDSAERLTVTEIYQSLRIEQSVASQHLAILRKTQLVVYRRNGKFIYYTLQRERLTQVQAVLQALTLPTDGNPE
ncbi:hypothetical protein LEM8419_02258 [Neolewinella maritima]|uniref:HTH arsR-type domain-containing protein n=1 Tax=Neolewinella maritima TaxID=1383882 RepID=A0ABM9B2K9_9BACT|nr:metalloregulator ArsR/SmtB family transcription factor [Neolewinella maritima]CAH1001357.1 hypothetical protein LEM8419_02258 [Neolewinella maritima]